MHGGAPGVAAGGARGPGPWAALKGPRPVAPGARGPGRRSRVGGGDGPGRSRHVHQSDVRGGRWPWAIAPRAPVRRPRRAMALGDRATCTSPTSAAGDGPGRSRHVHQSDVRGKHFGLSDEQEASRQCPERPSPLAACMARKRSSLPYGWWQRVARKLATAPVAADRPVGLVQPVQAPVRTAPRTGRTRADSATAPVAADRPVGLVQPVQAPVRTAPRTGRTRADSATAGREIDRSDSCSRCKRPCGQRHAPVGLVQTVPPPRSDSCGRRWG